MVLVHSNDESKSPKMEGVFYNPNVSDLTDQSTQKNPIDLYRGFDGGFGTTKPGQPFL